jgi:hypothetical protein
MPLVNELMMGLAEQDEILKAPALVIAHIAVVPIPFLGISYVSDLVLDVRLTIDEAQDWRRARREIAGRP